MTTGRLYLSVMWRRRWTLITWCSGALLIGTAYLALVEPVYEAEARALIQQRGHEIDGSTSKTYDKEFLSTQAEVIRSPLTIAAALTALAEQAGQGLDSAELDEEVQDTAKLLRVSPMAGTDIVRVAYQDSDADRTIAVLRGILDSYRLHLNQEERAASERSLGLLSEREETLRSKLAQLETEYAALRATTPLIGESRDSVNLASARVRDFDARLTALREQRRQLEQALTFVNAVSEPLQTEQVLPAIAMLDQNVTRALDDAQQELSQARGQLEAARSVYASRHPQLQAAQRRVAAAEARLIEQTEAVIQSLRQRLPLLESEEAQLTELLVAETEAMKLLDESLVQERRLAAEIEQTRELHQSAMVLLQEVQLSDQAVAQGTGSVHVRLLDDFVTPDEPIWPQPAPLLAACGFLSLLLGLIVVAVQERLPLPGLLATTSEQTSTNGTVAHFSRNGGQPTAEPWAEAEQLRQTASGKGMSRPVEHTQHIESVSA